MNRAMRARHATWQTIQDAVIETIGRASPLYFATIRARLGKDPAGLKFAALAARLPAPDRARVLASIEERV